MRRPNAWQQAIVAHLTAAGEPLLVEQLWQRMQASGFQHASKHPRSTLSARVAELVQLGVLSRVGPSTYRIAEEASGSTGTPMEISSTGAASTERSS